MDHPQTVEYLTGLTRSGIKLGLDNTIRLLEALGNPQLKVPTIHIAGTNGKGSTAAFTESILRAGGFRTGLYTSPHLADFRERIQVNRQPIGPKSLAAVATEVRAVCERENIPATYFEVGTAMAFLHFLRSGCEWNVIEVGMGGRLASTNVCQSRVAVITSISHDHESSLGNSLAQIAGEKAGIIKPGGTVIAGLRQKEPLEVVRQRARETGCPLLCLDREFQAIRTGYSAGGQMFDYSGPGSRYESLEIALLGAFQVDNAALAITAVQQALQGNIGPDSLREGLINTRWPGRLEVVCRDPLTLLDCAHNPDSVRNLTKAVREYFNYEKCRVVLGVMQDKDLPQIAEILGDFADEVILSRPRIERSADPHNLFKLFKTNHKVIEIIDEIQYALHTAQKRSGPKDLVVVAGSVFTVAEARQSFELQNFH